MALIVLIFIFLWRKKCQNCFIYGAKSVKTFVNRAQKV